MVGDVHAKAWMLAGVEAFLGAHDVDHVVVLGDYVDDWHATGRESLECLDAVVAWARADARVHLLVGNHDMAYYYQDPSCSGYNRAAAHELGAAFRHARGLLFAAVSLDGWLFTHAGVCGR